MAPLSQLICEVWSISMHIHGLDMHRGFCTLFFIVIMHSMHRGFSILVLHYNCRAFTKDDDTRLREAVKMYGESRWSLGEWVGLIRERVTHPLRLSSPLWKQKKNTTQSWSPCFRFQPWLGWIIEVSILTPDCSSEIEFYPLAHMQTEGCISVCVCVCVWGGGGGRLEHRWPSVMSPAEVFFWIHTCTLEPHPT